MLNASPRCWSDVGDGAASWPTIETEPAPASQSFDETSNLPPATTAQESTTVAQASMLPTTTTLVSTTAPTTTVSTLRLTSPGLLKATRIPKSSTNPECVPHVGPRLLESQEHCLSRVSRNVHSRGTATWDREHSLQDHREGQPPLDVLCTPPAPAHVRRYGRRRRCKDDWAGREFGRSASLLKSPSTTTTRIGCFVTCPTAAICTTKLPRSLAVDPSAE
jgi:hypothetical protein